MENNSGLRKILKLPFFYSSLQNLVIKNSARQCVEKSFWRFSDHSKIIDIGCGSGDRLPHLPESCEYFGIDISAEYIKKANNLKRNNHHFLKGTCEDYMNYAEFSQADVILCNGVIHHLNDEELFQLLKFVNKHIKRPGGRFLAWEPVHLVHESRISRYFMNQDRGMYIRSEIDLKKLLSSNLDGVLSTSIATSLFIIPYIHIFIECKY